MPGEYANPIHQFARTHWQTTLELILKKTAFSGAYISQLGPGSAKLVAAAHESSSLLPEIGQEYALENTFCGWLYKHKHAIHNARPRSETWLHKARSLFPMQSYSGFPLINAHGRVIASLNVYHEEEVDASDDDTLLLEELARYISAELSLMERNSELEQVTETDPLTGLRNRRGLEHYFDTLLALGLRAQHDQQERNLLTVILLDLDNFKQINDKHGHDVGDQVLVDIAFRLTQLTRGTDMICRWGGEEFLLAFAGLHDQQVKNCIDKIGKELQDAHIHLESGIKVEYSASMGYVSSQLATPWSRLIEGAEKMLEQAQNKGRACFMGQNSEEFIYQKPGHSGH